MFPESVKEDEWMKAVKEGLHPAASYSLVRHIRLVGMLLVIYSRYLPMIYTGVCIKQNTMEDGGKKKKIFNKYFELKL